MLDITNFVNIVRDIEQELLQLDINTRVLDYITQFDSFPRIVLHSTGICTQTFLMSDIWKESNLHLHKQLNLACLVLVY